MEIYGIILIGVIISLPIIYLVGHLISKVADKVVSYFLPGE